MTYPLAPDPDRAALGTASGWSRWGADRHRSIRMTANRQAEYAQHIAMALNAGVLEDAVPLGLEAQGQFKVDALDVLDALESAGLRLVVDERGEVREENVALIDARCRQRSSPCSSE